MKFWRNLSRRRRAASVEDSPPRSAPADLARQAEEDRLYSLGELATLDGFGLMKTLMLYRHRPIAHYLAGIGKRRSMLHADVLLLLYYLARHAPGDILEIGPYIGGSTIAAAQGVRDSGRTRNFLTVERGGQFAHPKIPSTDIVRDLKQNLATHGVSDLVQVIVGGASEERTKATMRQQLAPGSVGLLVMDADGAVEAALASHRDLLRDPCWVVIDDYYATGMALDKAIRTKTEIDAFVGAGELEALALFGWGTWFGRWHRN
jgi:predicted O-methyltransferase YrrM